MALQVVTQSTANIGTDFDLTAAVYDAAFETGLAAGVQALGLTQIAPTIVADISVFVSSQSLTLAATDPNIETEDSGGAGPPVSVPADVQTLTLTQLIPTTLPRQGLPDPVAYRTIRNDFRDRILSNTSITADMMAWEGREYCTEDKQLYVAEVCIISDEFWLSACTPQSLYVFRYNVYGKLQDYQNQIEEIEDLRDELANYFYSLKPYGLSPSASVNYDVLVRKVDRTTAENFEGWRIAPIDISVQAVSN